MNGKAAAHLPHPLYLPEILSIIFSHLPNVDLSQCLAVSRLWFDCAVQGLYKHVRIVDFLKVTESGRAEGGPRLGQFVLTMQDAIRLRKYAPHILTLSCTSHEYRNREVRHDWKAAGRSYALVPLDPLDQFSTMIRQWHALILSDLHLSPQPIRQGAFPTLQDLFPKLSGLRGGFDLDDDLSPTTSLEFTLPLDSPSALVNGLTYPLQAAYTYSMERELRGTELLLRSSKAYANLAVFQPYFFFYLRQSATLRELELAALWDSKTDAVDDWKAVWLEEETVPYPARRCALRTLVLRCPKPAEMFARLVHEDMLGPQLPELERLFFGVENAVDIEEWDMSESEEEGELHPFTIDGDEEMSDASEHGVEGEEMSTEESGTDSSDTDETDVTTSEEEEHHFHEASMSGSGSDGEGDWQTEDEIQVDGSDIAAAEAMFGAELLPGRLPSYFEDGYRPLVRFSALMKDGPALHALLEAVAVACPALKVLGWDGRANVTLGRAYAASSVEGRTEMLEREVRRVLETR
ncbi:hypothetical protein CALVIDRAFT_567359 [Calocera viscosa TUFC12733]|uniref:F-box domain-containing protein n=1 Tax=Calocera viscosa (strain TUFC12733) TaxID=1330018 RepID=A0A167IC49_CALVF|nr:hypothetical protein CALVIDRAFT_567359 [Calocera viscosa TUFC12733]